MSPKPSIQMGIPFLNAFFKKHTTQHSIKKLQIEELTGKTIAIDTSIYLYRFLAEEALMENIYTMLALFGHYKITPIFVFDGKAPVEKAKLLEKRSREKKLAEHKYKLLKQELKQLRDNENRLDICENMQALKKKFIRLKRRDVENVQALITAFGETYIEADAEADEVCAKLVIKKIAYACLSEDMDLFVYGCPRVLRYFSLMNETAIIYYLDKILNDLNMTLKEFKEICVISGTDYNFNSPNNANLYKTLRLYNEFKRSKDITSKIEFYDWLEENTNYIDNIYILYNIYNMFSTQNVQLKQYNVSHTHNTNLTKKEPNIDRIKELMIPEGFIFL